MLERYGQLLARVTYWGLAALALIVWAGMDSSRSFNSADTPGAAEQSPKGAVSGSTSQASTAADSSAVLKERMKQAETNPKDVPGPSTPRIQVAAGTVAAAKKPPAEARPAQPAPESKTSAAGSSTLRVRGQADAATEPQSSSALDAKPSSREANPRAATALMGPVERVELAGVERIAVKFVGNAELSGEYKVSSDGTVAIPALGRIAISGLTVAELEASLSDRFEKAMSVSEAFVTVDLLEYKPVFVSGLVTRPGYVPWRPGMTVLHAVSQLGTRQAILTTTRPEGAADEELERYRRSTSDLSRVLAVLAGLQAERDSVAAVPVPPELVAVVGASVARAMIQEETANLATRKAQLAAQQSTIEEARKLSAQELSALVIQDRRLQEVLAARRVFKQKVDGLLTTKTVGSERVLDETTKLGDFDDKATAVKMAIARVEAEVARLDQERSSMLANHNAMVEADIERNQREAERLQREIDASRRAYVGYTGSAPSQSNDEPSRSRPQQGLDYQLVREGFAGRVQMSVDQFTALKPGDTVIVSLIQ